MQEVLLTDRVAILEKFAIYYVHNRFTYWSHTHARVTAYGAINTIALTCYGRDIWSAMLTMDYIAALGSSLSENQGVMMCV